MAYPTILVNAGTGSDSAASGAGPGTALTGTAASYVTTTVTLDGAPDLSGVATDGSHCLYLVTSTGRRFFKITGVDNGAKTVTVSVAPAGTASGLTWAIGGKRATIDSASSALLFSADAQAGWTISIEDTAISVSASIAPNTAGDTTDGWITLQGATTCTITQTANAAAIACGASAAMWSFRNLAIKNTNVTKTNAHGISFNSSQYFDIENCNIGDATDQLQNGVYRAGAAPKVRFFNAAVHDCISTGYVNAAAGTNDFRAFGCFFTDNGSHGVDLSGSSDAIEQVCSCVFARNGGDGIQGAVNGRSVISGNTFDSNTGDGLEVDALGGGTPGYTVVNNQFTNNGGYGLNATSGFDARKGTVDFNNFYNNTSGARNNVTAGSNDLTLDPSYTNAAGDDFSIGTNTKAKGFPGAGATAMAAGYSTSISYVDIGAVQRREAGAAHKFWGKL